MWQAYLVPFVGGSGFRHLLHVVHGIVEHIVDGHGIMNFRLRLDSEHEINRFIVTHSLIQLQYIAKPLYRLFGIHAVRQGNDRRVVFREVIGSDYLPPAIQPKIEHITEIFWVRQKS